MRKILSLILALSCFFNQAGLAHAAAELNVAGYLTQMHQGLFPDKFRPLHLRYFSYDTASDNFKILLDKGDFERGQSPKAPVPTQGGGTVPTKELEDATQTLLNYFFVGISLPNDKFWVNLRPDSESEIIDSELARTDIGKIFLEADVQLKKDTAQFTSPETPIGKQYWAKLYAKAGELFGTENVTIPTLTRPWIVPDEIIIRETKDSAYVYKATLKVLLEEDYLKSSQSTIVRSQYRFDDPRLKTLNEYSSQLIRQLIIPKLTKEVNISKRYANLRQVYYSLILSRWFKSRFLGEKGTYASLIDKQDLKGLTSKELWSKTTYFNEYQKSFKDGEYNLKVPAYTNFGQTIRSYFSGGIGLTGSGVNALIMPHETQSSSPVGIFRVRSQNNVVVGKNMVSFTAGPNGILNFVSSPVGEEYHARIEDFSASIGSISPDAARRIREFARLDARLAVEMIVEEIESWRQRYVDIIRGNPRPGDENYSLEQAEDMVRRYDASIREWKDILLNQIPSLAAIGASSPVESERSASGLLNETMRLLEPVAIGLKEVLIPIISYLESEGLRPQINPLHKDGIQIVFGDETDHSFLRTCYGFQFRDRDPSGLYFGTKDSPPSGIWMTKLTTRVSDKDGVRYSSFDNSIRLNPDDVLEEVKRAVVAEQNAKKSRASASGTQETTGSSPAAAQYSARDARHDVRALKEIFQIGSAERGYDFRERMVGIVKEHAGKIFIDYLERHGGDYQSLEAYLDWLEHQLGEVSDNDSLVHSVFALLRKLESSLTARDKEKLRFFTPVAAAASSPVRLSKAKAMREIVTTWKTLGQDETQYAEFASDIKEEYFDGFNIGGLQDYLRYILANSFKGDIAEESPKGVAKRSFEDILGRLDSYNPEVVSSPVSLEISQEQRSKIYGFIVEKLQAAVKNQQGQQPVRNQRFIDQLNVTIYINEVVDAAGITMDMHDDSQVSALTSFIKTNMPNNMSSVQVIGHTDYAILVEWRRTVSSPAMDFGGIDLRSMNIIAQPMGNFYGLDFNLPKLTNVQDINLNEEFSQFKNMVERGIIPSSQRLKEFIAACHYRKELSQRRDDILTCLIDLFKLEEEDTCQTKPELKEALVLVDNS